MDVYLYYLKDPITKEIRYLGQTTNLKRRLYAHRYDALQKETPNPWKKNWIKKLQLLGLNPIMEVFRVCKGYSKEDVDKLEVQLINEYFENGFRLLNSRNAPPYTVGVNRKRKPVYQYDPVTREKTAVFSSVREASQVIKASQVNLRKAILKDGKSTYRGFLWSFTDYSELSHNSPRLTGRPKKKILATNMTTGDKTEFNSVSDAALQLSLCPGNISKVCNGKRFIAGNYTFSYM